MGVRYCLCPLRMTKLRGSTDAQFSCALDKKNLPGKMQAVSQRLSLMFTIRSQRGDRLVQGQGLASCQECRAHETLTKMLYRAPRMTSYVDPLARSLHNIPRYHNCRQLTSTPNTCNICTLIGRSSSDRYGMKY